MSYRNYIRFLELFHILCLNPILSIHWSNFVTNIKVLDKTRTKSIEDILLKSLLHRVGYVSKMENHRLPKFIRCDDFFAGHRNRGAPKKRLKDSTEKCCLRLGVSAPTMLSLSLSPLRKHPQGSSQEQKVPEEEPKYNAINPLRDF